MRYRKWYLAILVIIVAMMVTASAFASPVESTRSGGVTQSALSWQLSDAVVISKGVTVAMPQGVLVNGYKVESKGATRGVSLFASGQKEAKFEITLTAFQPSQDMPGQKKGYWYIQGTWKLTEPNANPDILAYRHNPLLVEGSFQAVSRTNPFTGSAATSRLEGTMSIPMSLTGGQWTKAEGAFAGNGLFEGRLTFDATRWPVMSVTR